MRNSPRISAATRKRVRDLAEKLGYRPDPEISRLMGRLRPDRKTRGSVVIGMIDLHSGRRPQPHPYDAGVREGISTRADQLGFGVTLFSLSDYNGSLKQLLRVVRHRGIEGVILLPSTEPVALDPALEWTGLSVVAATTTVTSPQFHQVIPNQLHNILALIESVQRRGHRKIGALFNESLDRRTHHYYSIALTWHGHRDRILVLPDATPEKTASERIGAWLREHSPDVIIGSDAMTHLLQSQHLATRMTGEIEVVALTSRPGTSMSYLDQRPAIIGECAVSLLTGMMHNHETGIPADPQVTTIRGILREPAGKRAAKK